MKKYGFECEYWVSALGSPDVEILVPKSVPSDECGYLAEVRGVPDEDPLTAAYLMLAEEDRLSARCAAFVAGQCTLSKNNPTRTLTPAFKQEALRRYGKNSYPPERGNIYGKDYSPRDKFSRSGLHVHFSNSRQVTHSLLGVECPTCHHRPAETSTIIVPQQQDIAKIVLTLDKAFATEIRAANRVPGFYELKTHGFEYRSLPSDVDPRRVAHVILSENL